MWSVVMFARIVLGVVFVVAGVAKLVNPRGTRAAVVSFGAEAFAPWLGRALPLAELGVGAALLIPTSAVWGARVAGGLLVVFTLVIAWHLFRGRTPSCSCFGQLTARPIGHTTLVRNGLLLGVAAVAARPTPVGYPALDWRPGLASVAAIELVLILLLAWAVFELWRQQARIVRRLEAIETRPDVNGVAASLAPSFLPVGSAAPEFNLASAAGPRRSLRDLLDDGGRPAVLVFVDPHCGPCKTLVPELARWRREFAHALAIVLISRAGDEAFARTDVWGDPASVLLQREREVAAEYLVPGTPAAMIVRSDGRVGSPTVMGAPAIGLLVRNAAAIHNTSAEPFRAGPTDELREGVPTR